MTLSGKAPGGHAVNGGATTEEADQKVISSKKVKGGEHFFTNESSQPIHMMIWLKMTVRRFPMWLRKPLRR